MTDIGAPVETTLLGGRVKCLQPRSGYRVALDTVLMAASVPVGQGQRLLDVGMGAGAAGLCVACRFQDVSVDGIEVQPPYADLARRNADLNGWGDRFRIFTGDIGSPPSDLRPDYYDHVVSNPPYIAAGRGRIPEHPAKVTAIMETGMSLRGWIWFCIRMAKTKGVITIVHRADRLEEILASLSGKVGELTIFPLWPGGDGPGRPAKRVIVQGRKGMKGPTTMSSGLILHQEDGDYTVEAKNVLIDARALEIR